MLKKMMEHLNKVTSSNFLLMNVTQSSSGGSSSLSVSHSITNTDMVDRGGVKITKVDADTLKAEAQGDGDLSGAKFTIYNASTNDVVVNSKTYSAGTSSSNNGVLSKNASNVTYMDMQQPLPTETVQTILLQYIIKCIQCSLRLLCPFCPSCTTNC